MKIHTLKGYRTGSLTPADYGGYYIFCDKNNNIIYSQTSNQLVGSNNAPVFWAYSTNVPTS